MFGLSLFWIGVALVLLGYLVGRGRAEKKLADAIESKLLTSHGVDLEPGQVPLWFSVSDPANPRYLYLAETQSKQLDSGSGNLKGVIVSAAAQFASGKVWKLTDVDYSINGRRQGTELNIDAKADEGRVVLEMDTNGPLNPLGISDRVSSVMVVIGTSSAM